MIKVNKTLKIDNNFMDKNYDAFENYDIFLFNGSNKDKSIEKIIYAKKEEEEGGEAGEYIFNRLDVRIPFIAVYSTVFFCCIFGNLMVILLVFLSKRLKSTTNFFLANLAAADLCVGIFCVLQNLSYYLITSWILGDFLCKMNQFIHGLSCTSSVFILVVISIERYLVIIHPIRCKQILTKNRLKVIIALVWIVSTAYSLPRYVISRTISHHLPGRVETICIMSRTKYNSKIFDIINFILLYFIPLGVMIILYSIIGFRLWNSELHYSNLEINNQPTMNNQVTSNTEGSTASFSSSKRIYTYSDQRKRSFSLDQDHFIPDVSHCCNKTLPLPVNSSNRSSKNVLRARRKVIKMLTLIVLAFAICNLPFHARKMWQYWSSNYNGASDFSALFTPITFLCTYCNSAINPLLYAFLSKNFQKSLKELLPGSRRSCSNSTSCRTLSWTKSSSGNKLHIILRNQPGSESNNAHLATYVPELSSKI